MCTQRASYFFIVFEGGGGGSSGEREADEFEITCHLARERESVINVVKFQVAEEGRKNETTAQAKNETRAFQQLSCFGAYNECITVE